MKPKKPNTIIQSGGGFDEDMMGDCWLIMFYKPVDNFMTDIVPLLKGPWRLEYNEAMFFLRVRKEADLAILNVAGTVIFENHIMVVPTKTFVCNGCYQKAQGLPDLQLICGSCNRKMERIV